MSGCSKEQPVRLLYWNIQNGMWDGQTDNYDRFVNWVKAQDPDICVWCEGASIYKTGTDDPLPKEERYLIEHWGELAARYGHNYWFVGGHRDNYPQVITSKYPIEEVLRMVGNEPDSVVTHGAGWAQIKINEKPLNIVTLHTWPMSFAFRVPDEQKEASIAAHGGNYYRRMEIEYICRHTIESVPDADKQYWMMMGDFNSRSRVDNAYYQYPEDDTRFLVHDYVREHTPYIDIIAEKHAGTFCPTIGSEDGKSNSRIDMVYATPLLYQNITEAEVIKDDYCEPVRNAQKISNFWHPSDHRPIRIDFTLK